MQSVRDRLEIILSRLANRAGGEKVYTKLYAEAARAAADAADARRKAGVNLGPLDGVIISIKDLFDVAGEPTRAGSLMRASAQPAPEDAAIVRRLRRAGAVILGKTNMTEFAFTAIGDNLHYGTPGNARDASLIPGGSSSGAGVVVGEGTSEISIGSDTGGSVRIPASLNGVVGFKPTASRVPLAGAFPLSATLDSIGPLARSVADCAIADAIMAGEEPAVFEPTSLAGLRVGIPRGVLFGETQAEVAEAFDRSVRSMERAGARVADLPIDDLIAGMRAATKRATIAAIEGAEVHADWLTTGAPVPVDPHVTGPMSRALTIPASVYIRTIRHRTALVAAMDERLAAVDVLVLPTVPMVAPSIAAMAGDEELRDTTEGLLLRNTQVANQFDLCAISLPMPGLALPAGLMLVARHGHDRHLLAVAAAMEVLLKD
ncbi:amidase [Mesorhizobium sp. M1C.F.Ca.ET.193.01.1.1]|uniref:amidase n=2 Tax=Mesorhizobium TaxID=68287 RepID=UPI000FD1B076|nr:MULTISPECIES: amidase [unclassified Mesorhizobium]TGS99144.1 amidase [bacterium M00.F.Ca.ET.177.01.1.1]TGQ53288.1 amidase [Mesorhizobium sp. M1C.F.Ca.ET.210.01.1.1]TGQ70556.1 amidase [Mesorhizobium sp. M1C.F.Ca.ET.212.01.1.1]TGR07052.1 amidase [Mesorhizobium sp. M1C.F.Ca.ET.204.01.1.1]TGR27624.1 amidase [Mesorhizobium sp. M1C.F.Ca.ET.196.01.1.1]